jgi:hypothetical protein
MDNTAATDVTSASMLLAPERSTTEIVAVRAGSTFGLPSCDIGHLRVRRSACSSCVIFLALIRVAAMNHGLLQTA